MALEHTIVFFFIRNESLSVRIVMPWWMHVYGGKRFITNQSFSWVFHRRGYFKTPNINVSTQHIIIVLRFYASNLPIKYTYTSDTRGAGGWPDVRKFPDMSWILCILMSINSGALKLDARGILLKWLINKSFLPKCLESTF